MRKTGMRCFSKRPNGRFCFFAQVKRIQKFRRSRYNEKMKKKKPRIVIVGGGFGGVRAALDLRHHVAADCAITLIDRNTYHSYTSDYYETATFFLSERERWNTAREWMRARGSVVIPFSDIFGASNGGFRFIHGEVERVLLDTQQVLLRDGKKILYDWLIFAPGSETNYFHIPRLSELSLALKTVPESLNIRVAVDELFLRIPKREVIRILIGGGGFTGCEFAGELIGYCKKLAVLHGHPVENIAIEIIEGSGTLLGGANRWVRQKAMLRFTDLGVKVVLHALIERVEPGQVFIKGNANPQSFHLLVWTAGIKGSGLAERLEGDVVLEKGYIVVDEYLRLPAYQNVFVAGDVAQYIDRKTPLAPPKTAQVAIAEGEYVAHTLVRLLRGHKIFSAPVFKSKFLVPLGGRYALADLGKIKLEGRAAWALKRFAALRYFLSILPLRRALTVWVRGVTLYVRND